MYKLFKKSITWHFVIRMFLTKQNWILNDYKMLFIHKIIFSCVIMFESYPATTTTIRESNTWFSLQHILLCWQWPPPCATTSQFSFSSLTAYFIQRQRLVQSISINNYVTLSYKTNQSRCQLISWHWIVINIIIVFHVYTWILSVVNPLSIIGLRRTEIIFFLEWYYVFT